ncbi:conserved hypothetical protein [Tenacibaculum sp. 190524A05c]|uniref:hypothetical protein n=1 Tax=Tenacibaculum platacis TaxID=3137852 RepID=UPI0031FABBB1
MARTIAEIQQEILNEKEKYTELSELTSTSKSAIWRLWIYIVSTAIWMHEKIVERNALLSRPHTLLWYREQALNFLIGEDLIWKDGYFQYPELSPEKVKEKKIITHCAISERLFEEINDDSDTKQLSEIISDYYYNQVGILTLKVAKEVNGRKEKLELYEKRAFRAYMNQIKDAGTQIRVLSNKGNEIEIELEVYVNPLTFYTGDENEIDRLNAGKLLSNLSIEPVRDAIKEYITTLEFNGAFVPTYLIDKIQQIPGVHLPILQKITVDGSDKPVYDQLDSEKDLPFFVPRSGYFNIDDDNFKIVYKPYNLQTDPNFNI